MESSAIREAAVACQQSLKKCLEIPHLTENGWAENRLLDFNLWAAGAGVSAKGKLSLDERLSSKTEIKNTLANLLRLLKLFVDSCQEQVVEQSAEIDIAETRDDSKRPLAQLSESEIEARKDVEVTLDQIIRLTVAIRKAGSGARLKRADKSFDARNPLLKELQTFLKVVIPPRGFKTEEQLTTIQSRLIDANLRRRHRFSYAKKHSQKLAGKPSGSQPKKEPKVPVKQEFSASQQLENGPIDTQEIEQVAESDSKPIFAERAPSTIALTVETAASAVEGTIIFTEKKAARAPVTVISRISSKISYPRPPPTTRFQTVFKCPCCCQSLPIAFTERSQWKKHLAGDILPYTCILENCEAPLHLYLTRKDWENHIKTDHGQIWSCTVCEQSGEMAEFQKEDDIIHHLKSQHQNEVGADEIAMFVDASCSSKPVEVIGCPLCSGPEEGQDCFEHIAQCVHDFSLRSLPAPGEDDDPNNYFDVDSKNSSSQNTVPSSQAEDRQMEDLPELDYDSEKEAHETMVTQITESSLKSLAQPTGVDMGLRIQEWLLAESGKQNSNEEARPIEDVQISEDMSNRYNFTVGCIYTHPDIYFVANLLQDQDIFTIPISHSQSNYIGGQIGEHKVVHKTVLSDDYPLSITVREMIDEFPSIRIIIVLGIGSGIPDHVRLGDAVIGTDIVPLKLEEEADDTQLAHTSVNRPDSLRNAIAALKAKGAQDIYNRYEYLFQASISDWPILPQAYDRLTKSLSDIRFESDVSHVHSFASDSVPPCDQCDQSKATPMVISSIPGYHHGRIGSVKEPVRSGRDRDKYYSNIIPGFHPDLMCLESKSIDLWHSEGTPSRWKLKYDIPLLLVEGISDYGDSHNKGWEGPAAVSAATYVNSLLLELEKNDLEREFTIKSHMDAQTSHTQQEIDITPMVIEPNEIKAKDLSEHVHVGARCIFHWIACNFTTSDVNEWMEHVNGHVSSSEIFTPTLATKLAPTARSFDEVIQEEASLDDMPVSWECRFTDDCGYFIETGHKLAGWQNGIWKPKLEHIYQHLTKQGIPPENGQETERWLKFYRSLELCDDYDVYKASSSLNPKNYYPPAYLSPELKYERLLNWLTPVSYSDYLAEQLGKCKPGFSHILSDSIIKGWMKQSSRIIISQGIAGSGKTATTAIFVQKIGEIREQLEDPGFAYIFCRGGLEYQQTAAAILANVLKQLISTLRFNMAKFNDTMDALESLYVSYMRRGTAVPLSDVTDLLRSVVIHHKTIFILIDGITEVDDDNMERSNLILGLYSIQQYCDRLHIWITSPPDEWRENAMLSLGLRDICLDIGPNNEDIEKYFDYRLKQITPAKGVDIDTAWKLDFMNKLNENSEITWIKARAALEDYILSKTATAPIVVKEATETHHAETESLKNFRRGGSVEELNEILGTMGPDPVVGLYSDALANIRNIQNENLRNCIIDLLAWVTFARRPLTQSELFDIVRFGLDEETLGKLPHPLKLLPYCSQFIGNDAHEQDSIDLTDYSARKYLERELLKDKVAEFVFFPHLYISNKCIQYMSQPDFRYGPASSRLKYTELARQHPFYAYASTRWGYHTKLTNTTHETVITFLENDQLVSAANQSLHFADLDGARWRASTKYEAKGLHLAAYFDLTQYIGLMIEGQNKNIDCHDGAGFTPLQYAVRGGSAGAVGLLLKSGASINFTPGDDNHPLFLALIANDITVVNALIEAAVDLECTNQRNETPLCVAAKLGRSYLCDILTERGANLNAQNIEGDTPLLLALGKGNSDILKKLLKKGANPRVTNNNGETSIFLATRAGNSAMVKELLEYGADPCSEGSDGRSILFLAIAMGNTEIAGFLIEKGGDRVVSGQNGETALIYAARCGQAKIVELLSLDFAIMNVVDLKHMTAVMHAAQLGFQEVFTLIEDKYVELDELPECMRSNMPITIAAKSGQIEIVSTIINRYFFSGLESVQRSVVFSRDSEGKTALTHAVELGYIKIVEILLDVLRHSYLVDALENYNLLKIAVALGDEEMVKLFLKRKDRPSVLYNGAGYFRVEYPYENSVVRGDVTADFDYTRKIFIECGASEEFSGNFEYWSPTAVAANCGHDEILIELCDNKVLEPGMYDPRLEISPYDDQDLISPDPSGLTPLMLAAMNGHGNIVDFFIQKTSAVEGIALEDSIYHRIPYLWAWMNGHTQVADSIRHIMDQQRLSN
ncbi:hypothetical protein H072_8571 [Dactylellina haptotyla CBS 200.50]|uniref:Nephrocystin 3-like N-terminal domain-containing protein n=1 Tax=Dactylellina haptotyla (strain CBS 200.50) TaxID=1284197 RepID=S8BEM6_DACHA|nr:hypothetical protein H072_8571 [Dactylellina haptotyla CBS 200.50]